MEIISHSCGTAISVSQVKHQICVKMVARDQRILDISVPGHFGNWLGQVSTELDILVLGTGQFGTWMRQFGTDHNCLVLINCQYFCTSSSLMYDLKVDGYVFLIVPV
jgi:hypothetical protein